MMAAIAMVGCGTMMSNAVAPSMRVCAASAQSADDAVKQLIADQNKAEQNALDYAGAGFTVVSSEMISGAENDHTFKVGVAPTANKKDVLYLFVGDFQCYAMSEYGGMTPDQADMFFAEKRVAESKVLTAAGKGYEIIGFQIMPGKGDVTKFKFAVVKSGTSQVTYYYADKNSCIADGTVKKPKQKASVEGTVGKIATAIIARLRNNEYTSMKDIVEYTDGEGTLTFHYDNVIWDDAMENIADGAVFTYCK